MARRPARLTDDEVAYVRRWAERFNVGETFRFSGWKNSHLDDDAAPKATTVGLQVVAALEAEPPDARLSFMELSAGPDRDGGSGPVAPDNARYYKRIE